MLTAIDKTGKKIVSYINGKRDESYFCSNPKCNSILIFKKGKIKIPHFAHKKNNFNCETKERNVEKHNLLKIAVYNKFKEKIEDLEYELWVGDNIGDVVSKKYKIVFECQCSFMTYEKIEERTEKWEKRGYKIIWFLHKDFFKKYEDLEKYDYKCNIYRYVRLNSMIIFLSNKFKKIYYLDITTNKNNLDYFYKKIDSVLYKITLLPCKITGINKQSATAVSGERYKTIKYKSRAFYEEKEIDISEVLK